MAIGKPFHRNYRGIKDGPNSGYSSWAYIVDRDYANNPAYFVRPFLLIQEDLKKLFEFIEPSDASINAYSFRMHELLVRSCIEIEANFKAILLENDYIPKKDRAGNDILNMSTYQAIDATHHLSSYRVLLPIWHGEKKVLEPFREWKTNNSLSWYQAYNHCKHDRFKEFDKANLQNVINAVAGLLIVLSSQFRTENFSSSNTCMALETTSEDMEGAIGGFFRILFPEDWKENEIYSFDWEKIKSDPFRFGKINYAEYVDKARNSR
jgi:hypothetical protein